MKALNSGRNGMRSVGFCGANKTGAGWSSGESARLRPTNVSGDYRIPGPGVICALSLLLVLYSVSRGFSPGSPAFSLSLKQNSISKFQFDPGMHGYL